MALVLVAGLGAGMAFGPSKSEANDSDVVDACVIAIDFALQEMESSAEFAIKVAEFMEADAKQDGPAMETAAGALVPINEKTTVAVNGFIDAAKRCG